MFRTVPVSIIRIFLLYTQQWCMSHMFVDSLRAGSGQNADSLQIGSGRNQFRPTSFLVLLASFSKPVWYIPLLCVQWKTLDDGLSNCPKHVEFYSRNKFEKLVHLVGFSIRIYLYCLTSYPYRSQFWTYVRHSELRSNEARVFSVNYGTKSLIVTLPWAEREHTQVT